MARTTDNIVVGPRPTGAGPTPTVAGRGRAWLTTAMRLSEFWRLMDEEFGETYSRSLAAHQSLTAFGGRTALELLEGGEPPRRVWEALTAQMDVPAERRLGRDRPIRERPGFG